MAYNPFAGAGSAFLVIYYLTCYSIAIAAAVLSLLASWKMFIKMGEPGWKGIIPFYNVYVMFQKVWTVKNFWKYIISVCVFILPYIIGLLLTIMGGVFMAQGDNLLTPGVVMLIIGIVFLLVALAAAIYALVVYFGLCKRLALSFGKPAGFAWGLLFLSTIFLMIIGFDKSAFVGKQIPD